MRYRYKVRLRRKNFPEAIRGEIRFWTIHCLLNVLPLFAWMLAHASPTSGDIFGMLVAALMVGLLCGAPGARLGGFSKSRALFPRALVIVLKLRVGFIGILLVTLGFEALGFAPPVFIGYLFGPDVLCVLAAGTIHGSLAENVSVAGNPTLEFLHPFLNSFVGISLLALVWALVFVALSLFVMIPLRLLDERGRGVAVP